MTEAERIETILAEQRCRDVHGDTYTPPFCESCRGWAAHVAALVAAETGGGEGARCICTRFVALPWCPADHDEDACRAKHPTNTSVIPCMIYGRPHTEHWSWSGCAGGHFTWTDPAAETGGLSSRACVHAPRSPATRSASEQHFALIDRLTRLAGEFRVTADLASDPSVIAAYLDCAEELRSALPAECPSCGSVGGYASGPPCLTCHYAPALLVPDQQTSEGSERTFTATEVIEIANETSDSLGNLYRLDFIDRINHEAEGER